MPKKDPIVLFHTDASEHSLLCQLLFSTKNSKINVYMNSNTENETESSKRKSVVQYILMTVVDTADAGIM